MKKPYILEVYYSETHGQTMRAELESLVKNPYFVQMELAQGDAALTPTQAQIDLARGVLSDRENPVKLNLMINPGDPAAYQYGEADIITQCRFMEAQHNVADGFVVGAMIGDQINVAGVHSLVQAAQGKPVTFHRAFDAIPTGQVPQACECLAKAGVAKIMISGAVDGNFVVNYPQILAIQTQAQVYGIQVMARGGIEPQHFIGADGVSQALLELGRQGGGVHARFSSPASGKKPSLEGLDIAANYLINNNFFIVSGL